MAERVHVSVHVAVAAGAGMRRVALFRAGRRGHNSSVTVLMRKFWDGFGLCLAAAGAGEGLDAALGLRRLLGYFAIVPAMAERVHISVHVAVAAGAGVGRIALFRAGRRGHDSVVVVLVRQSRNNFLFCVSAQCACICAYTVLSFGCFSCNNSCIPYMVIRANFEVLPIAISITPSIPVICPIIAVC